MPLRLLSNDGTRVSLHLAKRSSTRASSSNRSSNENFCNNGAGKKGPCKVEAIPVGGDKKRSIDVAFAAFWLAFFLPLFGLIALLIKCSDGGPVFYRHWRIGHARRPFECLKFRTMVMDGDEVLLRHFARSTDASREWQETRKLKKDPRVTAVGGLLRTLSLDELPQLINILRGEMSIVGPRPIVSDEIKMYGQHAELYFQARPGLTGLWQVSGRNDRSYNERVALDCTYVQSWSLRTDFLILARTIPAVLSSRGSY